jgi:hypothetical protein
MTSNPPTNTGPLSGPHDDNLELVPLAEPDEHGNVTPPAPTPTHTTSPNLNAPGRPDADGVVRPTVVTSAYTGPNLPKDPASTAAAGDPASESDDTLLIRPGFPGYRVLFITGGLLTIAAVALTGIYAPNHTVARSLSTLYDIAMHTGTGVAALLIASLFTERKFREVADVRLGAARMFVMVAALYTVVSIPMPIPLKFEEWILGLAAYGLLLYGLFRLPREDLGIIAGAHVLLWFLVKLGASIAQFIAASSPG